MSTAYQLGTSVFWEDKHGGIWSAVVTDRYMLGGLCTTIYFDGIVRPTGVPSHHLGPTPKDSYRRVVPATELKVRKVEPDDAEKRAAWEATKQPPTAAELAAIAAEIASLQP